MTVKETRFDIQPDDFPITIEFFKVADRYGQQLPVYHIVALGPTSIVIPPLGKEFGPVWSRFTTAKGGVHEAGPEGWVCEHDEHMTELVGRVLSMADEVPEAAKHVEAILKAMGYRPVITGGTT